MNRLFFLSLLLMGILYGDTPICLVQDREAYTLFPYFEYSAVKKQNETPLELTNHLWSSDKSTLVLDTQNKNYWIHFVLKNTTQNVQKRYLISEKNYTYSLEYYLRKQGKIVAQEKQGFRSRPKEIPIWGTHMIFPLSLENNETVDIFFKVQNFNQLNLPFKLVTQTYMTNFFQSYNLLQGAFFAVLIIMALYNLILYFIIKFKPYLYYVGYALSLALYMAIHFGYFQCYTSWNVGFIYAMLLVMAVLFIIFLIFFLEELFTIKKYLPLISHLLRFVIGYLLVGIFIFEIFYYFDNFQHMELLFNSIMGITPICVGLILFSLYYLAFKTDNHLAFLYALIWTVVGSLGLGVIAMYAGFILIDSGMEYIFEGGMLIEALLFSVMLAFRIKEIEKEKTQQQIFLVQQNKLASMGKMVSTIAHQWRQPLHNLSLMNQVLMLQFRKNKLDKEAMENFNRTSIREITEMSNTLSTFMNFFNTQKKIEVFYLSEVIEKAKTLLNHRLKAKLTINVVIENDIEIKGFPSELIQAFLIVLNNALDACTTIKATNPEIIINVENDEKYVQIFIEDNGGGIESEILKNIFDPYFTTKPKAKGTGLGLYILKMIIEQSMQGKVVIINTNRGAVCEMVIPIDINVTNKKK